MSQLQRRTPVATSAVIREQLSSIVRKMRRSMVQSSYSSIIYEGYDFSCVLIDGQGRLIAASRGAADARLRQRLDGLA